MFFLFTIVFLSYVACCKGDKGCNKISNNSLVQLFEKWNNALQSENITQIVNLYSDNSILLATLENEPRVTRIQKEKYFEEFLLKNPYGKLVSIYTNVNTNTPSLVGTYNFEINVFNNTCAPNVCGAGKPRCTGSCRTIVKARYTYIYSCIDKEWKIYHHHSSKFPN